MVAKKNTPIVQVHGNESQISTFVYCCKCSMALISIKTITQDFNEGIEGWGKNYNKTNLLILVNQILPNERITIQIKIY